MPAGSVRELSTGRYAAVCAAVALVAAAGVAFAASPIPRVTPDSASYLTAAEKLAHDGTFADCRGPIALFAPGYSAAMSPLVALGVDATDASRVVNVLATFVLVLAAGLLARGAGLSRVAGLVVTVAVAAAYATLRDGALAWSEPLFCAILAALLVVVVGHGRGLPVRMSARLAAAVALTWALLLTRHSGVFLLPAVLVAAWLGTGGFPRRATRLVALALALVAIPALWWARDHHVDGSLFGRRSGSRFGALDVLWQLPDGVASLALPNALPLAIRLLVLVPLLVAAALAVPASRGNAGMRLAVWVLGVAMVGYGAAVTLAAMRTVVDPIDTRLMSPLLVPGAVLVAIGLSGPCNSLLQAEEARPRVPKSARDKLLQGLRALILALVAVTLVLAPGVVWRGHTAERSLANVPDDVSCAKWPAQYSDSAVGLAFDRG